MYKIFNENVKVQIYHNTKKKTASTIRKELGCDYVLNGWVFNFKTFAPCDWLRTKGKTIKQGVYNDWSLCIDNNGKPSLLTNFNSYEVLSGSPLLKNGIKIYRNLTPDVKRNAERTAVFWTKEGHFGIYVDKAILSPEKLRNRLIELGAVDALLMDGGGSTQVSCSSNSVYSSRIVATLICVWVNNSTKADPKPTPATSTNPYPIPTRNLKRGCSDGEDVKWLQCQLNLKIKSGLPITGNFYTGTETAVINFQKKVFTNYKDWDGIVGPATRKKLME